MFILAVIGAVILIGIAVVLAAGLAIAVLVDRACKAIDRMKFDPERL